MSILSLFLVLMSSCSTMSLGNNDKETDQDKGEAEQEPVSTSEYDVYLIIGQSNAAGRGELISGDELPIEGVKMIWSLPYGSCRAVDACQPLNRYSTVRKAEKNQKFNFGGPFAAKIYRQTGKKVLLIVNARASSSLDNWLPSSPQLTFSQETGDDQSKWGQPVPQLYGEAVRIVKQVLSQKDIKGELKAVLWHQGCSDSSEAKSQQYCTRLKTVVDGLRSEFNDPNLPFVVGQLLPEYKNAQYFNTEIAKIGEVIENAYCVSSEGCTSVGDATHFNRNSLIVLGERYADVILDVVYGSLK